MIKVIAVLCSLSNTQDCHEVTVTNSDFAQITMQGCMTGAVAMADWMKDHPVERLIKWRCEIGQRAKGI
jgi:hypothetical protein